MRNFRMKLLLTLFCISLLSVLAGTVLLTINNIFLNHATLTELLQFNIPVVMSANMIILLLLMMITALQLRDIRGNDDLQLRLIKLPFRMFVIFMSICFVFSLAYHYVQFYFYGIKLSELTATALLILGKNLVSEQVIALVIGIMQYALSRSAIRPYMMQLQVTKLPSEKVSSFIQPLKVAYISCFLITSLVGIEYLIWNLNGPVDVTSLLIATGAKYVFSVLVFLVLTLEIRGSLRAVSLGLSALLENQEEGPTANRSSLHRPLPVLSKDELGQLIQSFNELQHRTAADYAELEEELRIARHVQHQLLPDLHRIRAQFEIAAHSQPCREVGGDLFDVVDLPDGGMAVMVGDVSGKGLSAALLMSGAISLFRTELRRGGSPGELLTRMNKELFPALQGKMFITMGIGLWRPGEEAWRYASAGHLPPFLIGASGSKELADFGALPLGMDEEAVYETRRLAMGEGELLLFYTDGIIEGAAENGEMFGFERFEAVLSCLADEKNGRELLADLVSRLSYSSSARYDDDKTLLLIRRLRPVPNAMAQAPEAIGAFGRGT